MLVLSRKVGGSIMIGDDIEITILDIQRGQARIGVTAPKDVSVDRAEIRERPDYEPRANYLGRNR